MLWERWVDVKDYERSFHKLILESLNFLTAHNEPTTTDMTLALLAWHERIYALAVRMRFDVIDSIDFNREPCLNVR